MIKKNCKYIIRTFYYKGIIFYGIYDNSTKFILDYADNLEKAEKTLKKIIFETEKVLKIIEHIQSEELFYDSKGNRI